MFKRKDGERITDLPSYRQLMPFLMPTRNESVVYYDTYVKAEKLEAYLKSLGDNPHKITITHCVLKACAMGMKENPKMNRFVCGYRLYQRDKIEISFSMKKEKVSRSPIKVVKMEVIPEESVEILADRIQSRLQVERSDKKTYTDKEIVLVTLLPRFLLRFLVWFLYWLDAHNLLPYGYIKSDPMYASLFIANLGTLGMDAGFHHLYEYGTIPLFGMVGEIRDMPVVEDGKVCARRLMHIRWSYDERIDDGLTAGIGINSVVRILEDPLTYFSGGKPQEKNSGTQ